MIYSLIVIDVQVCIWFSAKSEPQDLCRIGGLNIAISISNIAVYFIKIAGMDTQNYKLCLFFIDFHVNGAEHLVDPLKYTRTYTPISEQLHGGLFFFLLWYGTGHQQP